MAVGAVHRYEIARPHHLQHAAVIILAAVPAYVDVVRNLVVDDTRAATEKVVDRAVEQLLVAGDRRRAQHDRVPGRRLI